MTYRRDYLLRLIDEFSKFLSKILQLQGEKHYQQALELIDETAKTLLHLNLNDFVNDEEAVMKSIENKLFNFDQLEILAELLMKKGDIYLDMVNNFSAISCYEKSLYLFEYLQIHSKNYSVERVRKMEDINFTLMNLKA